MKEVSEEAKKDNLLEGREAYDAFHQKVEALRAGSESGSSIEALQFAADRAKTLPSLAMTGRDHTSIGSTPNYGKTLDDMDRPRVDFLDNEGVVNALDDCKQFVQLALKEKDNPRNGMDEKFYQDQIRNLKMNLEYLKQVDRLPEEYKDFDMDSFVESLGSNLQ